MAFFLDEAVRETMQPQGDGTFNLIGAPSGRQPFSTARRLDGQPVESGDTTVVTLTQSVQDVTLRAIAVATLNLGGSPSLTPHGTLYPAGKMFFSTAGASLPDFSTEQTGEAFITFAVPTVALFDPDGNLLQSANYRKTIAPSVMSVLTGGNALSDNEAAFPLFRNGTSYSGLAGLFAQNNQSTGTVDGVDKHQNANTGQGRIDRVPMKTQPTIRGNTIGAGGVLDLNEVAPWFTPSDPKASFRVEAWDEGDPSVRVSGHFLGSATLPVGSGCIESNPARLVFDRDGTSVRIRNTHDTSRSFAIVVERVG